MAVSGAVAGTPLATTTNATSFATASWSPTDGKVYWAAVGNTHGTAATALNTLTGNGLTWVQSQTQLMGNSQARVTLMRCLAAGSSAGAMTADFSGVTQTGCFIHIVEWTGVDTGGTNGSASVVGTPVGAAWNTTNPSITLPAFSDAANGTYGAFMHGADPAVGGGFTLVAEGNYAAPNRWFISEWRADNDTGVDITAASEVGVGIAAEVKVAPAAGGDVPYPYIGGGYYPFAALRRLWQGWTRRPTGLWIPA